MNLNEALKYGVVADFHSGEKQAQFAGLLENAARKDTQFGMGLVADFADDHNHPLAPVFRRIANGEAEEGTIEQHAQRLPDETAADPQFSFNLHSKTASVREPYASVDLLHHFERGPVWQVRTHTGWPNGTYGDWPEGKSYLLPATEEEMDRVAAEYGADDRGMVSDGIKKFRDALRQETAEQHRVSERSLRYGVAEAQGLAFDRSGNSEAAAHLQGLIKLILEGDHNSIGVVADLLSDADHPAAQFLRRVWQGEGQEGNYIDHFSLKNHSKRLPDDPYNSWGSSHLGGNVGSYQEGDDKPGRVTIMPLSFKDGRHYVQVGFGNYTKEGLGDTRSFLLPSSKEEIEQYGRDMAEIEPGHSKAILEASVFPNHSFENYSRRRAGIPPLPTEEPVHHRSLSEALKYITAKPEEWTHHLADPQKRDLHLIWADVLNDNGKDQLAESVRSEAMGAKRGVPPRPEEGPAYRVLTELNHRHPSPAIRALADNAIKEVYNNLSDFTPSESEALLIDALRKSEHPADQDAGVFLSASEDYPHLHHPAAKHLRHLQRHQFANAGLHPKLIGDTLYLLDENHPEQESYGAPAIRYHAHIGDKQDLDGLVAHAEELRQQQEQL